MPTYQYRCKACGHDFEIQQSFSDDALETCPECAGALKKVYGSVGISFKGSGFYKNDARTGSKSSSSSKTTSTSDTSTTASSESSSSTSSGSDKTPATTSTSSD